MPTRTLTPKSNTSSIVLSSTGSVNDVSGALPFGIYMNTTGSEDFISGAVDQVAYTFKKLGGDILDIEISDGAVYTAYEEAVLEYSYIVNIHQSKNILSNVLGGTTASFDQHGKIKSKSGNQGEDIALKYPRFDFSYARRVADGLSQAAGIGGTEAEYSASIETVVDQQDYDLQALISSASTSDSTLPYYNEVGNTKIIIKNVFYKTPHAMWRFYGYYGGLNVVGNLSNYGQWSDDSTFEVIPPWQNKMQATAFEDAIYTRNSHYSYEIKNNKLRIYPTPVEASPAKFWVRFTIPRDPWTQDDDKDIGIDGINNMNTVPFQNIPYININSIGKQWIRRFALSLTKEIVGQVRGKFASIPIPGESVTLNGSELLSQAKEEQEALRTELKETLAELTYSKLAEDDAGFVENTENVVNKVPMGIFVG